MQTLAAGTDMTGNFTKPEIIPFHSQFTLKPGESKDTTVIGDYNYRRSRTMADRESKSSNKINSSPCYPCRHRARVQHNQCINSKTPKPIQ
jgi:hypothetical protein